MTRNGSDVCRAFALGSLLAIAATSAGADNADAPAPARAAGWEIEVHGGGVFTHASDGTLVLPPPGETAPTFSGAPTRMVSSWYFGDGTTLFNEATTDFRTSIPAITALDAALQHLLNRPAGAALGLRVAKTLNPVLSAEITFDYNAARLDFSNASRSGIQATSASYLAAWQGLTRPFTAPSVSSTPALSRGGHEILAAGALIVHLRHEGTLIPFISAGAGIRSDAATGPTATLAGDYDFGITTRSGAIVPFHETDTVVLSTSVSKTAVVGVLGFGVKYRIARRWGLRADVRGYFGRNRTEARLNTKPTVATVDPDSCRSLSSPCGALDVRGGSSALQFVNAPEPRLVSSLSGPALQGFEVLSGGGLQGQISGTAGFFLRF